MVLSEAVSEITWRGRSERNQRPHARIRGGRHPHHRLHIIHICERSQTLYAIVSIYTCPPARWPGYSYGRARQICDHIRIRPVSARLQCQWPRAGRSLRVGPRGWQAEYHPDLAGMILSPGLRWEVARCTAGLWEGCRSYAKDRYSGIMENTVRWSRPSWCVARRVHLIAR